MSESLKKKPGWTRRQFIRNAGVAASTLCRPDARARKSRY